MLKYEHDILYDILALRNVNYEINLLEVCISRTDCHILASFSCMLFYMNQDNICGKCARVASFI